MCVVSPDLLDADVVLLELCPDEGHEVAQLHLQGGEVAAAVDGDHLVHEVAQPVDLLVRQDREPLVLKIQNMSECSLSRYLTVFVGPTKIFIISSITYFVFDRNLRPK